jgi:hypothetical protein
MGGASGKRRPNPSEDASCGRVEPSLESERTPMVNPGIVAPDVAKIRKVWERAAARTLRLDPGLLDVASEVDAAIALEAKDGRAVDSAIGLARLALKLGVALHLAFGLPGLRAMGSNSSGFTHRILSKRWDDARAMMGDARMVGWVVDYLMGRADAMSPVGLAIAVDRVGVAIRRLTAAGGWRVTEARLDSLADRAPAVFVERNGYQYMPVRLAFDVVRSQQLGVLGLLNAAGVINMRDRLLHREPVAPRAVASGLWTLLVTPGSECDLFGLGGAAEYDALEEALARLAGRASDEQSVEQSSVVAVPEPPAPAGFAECGDDPARIVACIVRDQPNSLIWFYVLLTKNAPMSQTGMGKAARAVYDAEGPRWGWRPRPGERGPQTAERIAYLVSSGIVERRDGDGALLLTARGKALRAGLLNAIEASLDDMCKPAEPGLRLLHG